MILINVTKDKEAKVPRKKLSSTISFGLLKYNNNDIYESFDKELIQYSIIQSFSFYGDKMIRYFDEK